MNWFTYIVKGKDGSLYSGITTDLLRRVSEHNTDAKKGAKSLRSKLPVTLVYYEAFISQADATRRERAIKRWKRDNKLKLIERFNLNSIDF